MTELGSIGAISLFVADIDTAKRWYATTFERPLVHEDSESATFDFGGTVINLLVVTAAPELIDPAPVAEPSSGARSQMTIWVDDADATVARLAGRGVALVNGPLDRPWGQRTACFADPDGHLWEIAQSIG